MAEKNRNRFLANWYKKNGSIYQFVFHCSHAVTNIQYRELVELIRMHIAADVRKMSVGFMTKNQMLNQIEGFLEEFSLCDDQFEYLGGEMKSLYDDYIRMFEHTIIIEAYHTSCIVWIPDCLHPDIAAICSESGYIFTCGKNVYHQLVEKAEYREVEQAVQSALNKISGPVQLLVYDEKDFSFRKKGYEDDYKDNGLSNLQLEGNRSYLKNISINDAVIMLKKNSWFIEKNNVGEKEKSSILWIYKDSDIFGMDTREQQTYYNCVQQMWINENPCYLFDTDHPAWNNTLIPHTFVGAMVNIFRGEAKREGKKEIRVMDAFVGSGTTLLETVKYPDMVFCGGDISRLAKQMTDDNLHFFSLDSAALKHLVSIWNYFLKTEYPEQYESIMNRVQWEKSQELYSLLKFSDSNIKDRILVNVIAKSTDFVHETLKADNKMYESLFPLMEQELLRSIENAYKMENITVDIKEKDETRFFIRLFLYQYRKSYLSRIESEVYQEKFTFQSAVCPVLKSILFRTLEFLHIKCRSEIKLMKMNPADLTDTNILYFDGKYASSGTVRYSYPCCEKYNIMNQVDVFEFLKRHQMPDKQVDLIITDPPYGFNTDESADKLYHVYDTFIQESVKCLRDGGQIIVCLLAKTHQGKGVHGFTKKKFVLRAFEEAAVRNHMRMVESDLEFRDLGEDFGFPFYWESKKVLRREVIRLEFLKTK